MALTGGQAPPNDIHLIGQFIELHTVNPELDGPELYEASHGDNAVLWQYMPDGPFATLEDYKKSLYARLKDPAWRPFTVVQKGTGKKVGQVNYLNIEPNHRRVELGAIWYTPSVQRSAVNTEAMYLLLKDSFETLNYRRVEWKCDNNNEKSKAAAKRLGFTYEGVFRQHMITKGRNRDTYRDFDENTLDTHQLLAVHRRQ